MKPPTRTSRSDDADPWAANDTLRVLLYGQSGTGKTTFWATFPGPIKVLLCSGGRKPGELRSIDTPENRRKISPVVVTDTTRLAAELEDAKNFATTVLDHGSGLADLVLKEILGLDELPAQKSWGMASQQDYGQQALKLKEVFRTILNLPGHSVIVAQERTWNGGDEGGASDALKPTVGAAFSASVTGWLNPACDYVLQTFKRPRMTKVKTKVGGTEIVTETRGKGVEYCLRCEPHDVVMTKFRLPVGRPLPDVIVDPTYDKIAKVLAGG